ncbi:hypothetical protein J9303_05535 [Bacillaceae bacterium Marseille-Q3522]|nr:hypothetical protein [Bacillaceae bacterium Marseille-Q3522]
MFDPTAYENLKVVIEGAVYDRDLNGEIRITDRNNIVNLSKLSRTCEVSFTTAFDDTLTCKIQLEGTLENFIAERISTLEDKNLAGCTLRLFYHYKLMQNHSFDFQEIKKILLSIWGKERTVKLQLSHDPLFPDRKYDFTAEITFNRIITENQVDDLMRVVEHSIKTMDKVIRKFSVK